MIVRVAAAAWMAASLGAGSLPPSPTVAALARPAVPATAHDLHVSHARVVVEARSVLMRIRFFHDDLDSALVRHAKRPGLHVAKGATFDSLFVAYATPRLVVQADGRSLSPRVLDAGTDPDPSGEPVWWYLLQYDAPAPVRRLALRNALLFDAFDTQQNLMTVLRSADGRRVSLYFTPGEDRVVPVEF